MVENQHDLSTDGTLEGLLTAISIALEQDLNPNNIILSENPQISLFGYEQPVITNFDLAESLKQTVLSTLGSLAYRNIKALYLSDDPKRGGVALRYLQYTLLQGSKSLTHLAHAAVADAEYIIKQVEKECRFMIQFVRFADVGGGLFYAQISPKASVVPLIMNHFANRYNIQPFVIFDHRHSLSGVFNTQRWWLVEGLPQGITSPTAADDHFTQLWQTFFKTIAVSERVNHAAQRNFMPKRFWGDLCEQQISYKKRGEQFASTITTNL